jgi:hypothetical protein
MYKISKFRVDHTTNIATIGSLLFVIGQLKKGRFCIKFPHLVQLGKQTRPPYEQSLQRTFHRGFLPSFGSFGLVVSEEKNKKNSQSETRIACELLLYWNDVWEIMYKICKFCVDHTTNIATIGSLLFVIG